MDGPLSESAASHLHSFLVAMTMVRIIGPSPAQSSSPTPRRPRPPRPRRRPPTMASAAASSSKPPVVVRLSSPLHSLDSLPASLSLSLSSARITPTPSQLGCGAVSADYLATVASFPNPDDKIRSLTLKVQGGGNTGNALTAAARLGLRPRIISKVLPTSLAPPSIQLLLLFTKACTTRYPMTHKEEIFSRSCKMMGSTPLISWY